MYLVVLLIEQPVCNRLADSAWVMLWLGQWLEIEDWASGSEIENWQKMRPALLRPRAVSKNAERMRISVKCLVTLMVQYSFPTLLQKYILRPFICKAKLHVWRFGSKDNSTGYIYYYVSLFFIEYYISAFYSLFHFLQCCTTCTTQKIVPIHFMF